MNPEDIVQMVEGMTALDFSKSPSIIFSTKLRNRLVERSLFDETIATELVLAMTIELGNENIFSDEQMDRMVEAYATLVANADTAMRNAGLGAKGIFKIAEKFSLKLS